MHVLRGIEVTYLEWKNQCLDNVFLRNSSTIEIIDQYMDFLYLLGGNMWLCLVGRMLSHVLLMYHLGTLLVKKTIPYQKNGTWPTLKIWQFSV